MQYVSTRGESPEVSFQEAVLGGLAPDGGLYVPKSVPQLANRLEELRALNFEQLACLIFGQFCDDIPSQQITQLVTSAYCLENYGAQVAPLRSSPCGFNFLELIYGPTLAFKDVALQLLGRVFQYILDQRNEWLNILAATSGDTGSAAICGLLPCPRIASFVMHPKGKIAPLQEIQMTSVIHPRVHNLAIEGDFDDCQSILKQLLSARSQGSLPLGAVNSVNWCRIMAQTFYYAYASLHTDQRADFVVPTGNFGNVLAGYYAKAMGFPIGKLVVATNQNKILHDYFSQGHYQRGPAQSSLAPAMDIQVASNFERFLYHHWGAQRTAESMRQFGETGRLSSQSPDQTPHYFESGWASDTEILETIASQYQEFGEIVDPHTAVALKVAKQRQHQGPTVVVATAHPAKFPDAIAKACGLEVTHPKLEALIGQPTRRVDLSNSAQEVDSYLKLHALGRATR